MEVQMRIKNATMSFQLAAGREHAIMRCNGDGTVCEWLRNPLMPPALTCVMTAVLALCGRHHHRPARQKGRWMPALYG
jgi:hypothetical protein